MKRRHVRVIAAVAVVFVALTGARRSGGGGCDNDHGSSGGSSGSYSSTGGDTTTGSTTSGTTGSTDDADPEDQDATGDITADKCTYDEAAEKLNYTVTVTNSSAKTYTYWIYVEWVDTSDNGIIGLYDTADAPLTLGPGESRTFKAEDTYHFVRDDVRYRCTVDSATKTAVA